MIIFLYGEDTFRSRQQLKKMIEKFTKERDPAGLNVVRLDVSSETRCGTIMAEVLAAPFLAERRMVVLENVLVSKNKDVQTELLRRLVTQTLPESNVLICWEGVGSVKTKDAKALFEQLQKEKFSQVFEPLVGAKLQSWVTTEIAERKSAMTPSAVQYLVNQVGGDMWRIASVLDQLVAYVGGGTLDMNTRAIEREDVQLFLSEKGDDNIFTLIDAIVARQPKTVYRMIEEQYRQGEDAMFVFAMLVRQYRILLQLRDVFERTETFSSDAAASQLKLHPFVVKKSLSVMKRYTMAELRTIYKHLLDFDIAVKTGRGDPATRLDVLVGKLCLIA